MTASPPPESRRLRHVRQLSAVGREARLTPPGIAATAAAAGVNNQKNGVPPHPPRNRGDCGFGRRAFGRALEFRLTPPGIAATAAGRGTGARSVDIPPHPPRNRGDCGTKGIMKTAYRSVAASPPPESRRLRLLARGLGRLRGLAASPPPESRRLRRRGIGRWKARFDRLTPPGIAATAAPAAWRASTAARRLTPPGIAATAAAKPTTTARVWLTRLTPPGIAATAAPCIWISSSAN